jgi:fumarylacetoacetate (FAA) hydrolase
MTLATLRDGTPDGSLIVVSPDATRYVAAAPVAPTLQAALEGWVRVESALREHAARLESGGGMALPQDALAAPLPRAWQWLDGSAFDSHGRLLTRLFGLQAKQSESPLMYQGLSHQFLGPYDEVPLPLESDDIDFEGEFGVITDVVPMGVSPTEAAAHVRLVVLLNDWSLRALGREEMKTGFGFVQAKPACSVAPFAVTPDALGIGWHDERVQMRLRVEVNGARFGEPHGGEMSVGFGELIAHAAATRSLCAGTIVGSGTVSNDDYRTVGSSCIAERRAIELLDNGAATTEFLRFGDRVRMRAIDETGTSPFGAIDQRVVEYRGRNGRRPAERGV